MIFKIAKFILRNVPDKWRSWLMIVCMMESALVRPGNTVKATLTVAVDGSHDFTLNDVEWSCVKKDRARAMLKNKYSLVEVANAFGVTVTDLKMQLLEDERVEQLHAKAAEALLPYREDGEPTRHPVTGLTWDQMKREGRDEHRKGDF